MNAKRTRQLRRLALALASNVSDRSYIRWLRKLYTRSNAADRAAFREQAKEAQRA